MKKFIDGLQLVLFFGLASILYLYTSNMVGASINKQKSIIEMEPKESYQIWKAIKELEDLWYSSSTGNVRDFKDSKNVEIGLIRLVKPYGELSTLVVELLKARKNNDVIRFTKQKEKIAEVLRPIWKEAIIAARKRRKNMGWGEWIKENIRQSMNRLYFYFFPTKTTKTKHVGKYDEVAGTFKVTTVEQ